MNANLEKIYKALGDKSRLRIVNMLASKAMCVCEITQIIKLSQSTVSGHLRVLKDARLLQDEKNGLWVEYSLNKETPLNANILALTLESLEHDPKMKEERDAAKKANREVICK